MTAIRLDQEATAPARGSHSFYAAFDPVWIRHARVARRSAVLPTFGGAGPDGGPRFDADVPPGGYLWWYVDAQSDDGRYGLTLITFIGSVFSPYYAWTGWADPFNHCAVNLALYRLDGGAGRWAMTERPKRKLTRDASHISIGPSSLSWEGGVLTATIDEIASPLPERLRGTIRLRPEALTGRAFALDAAQDHVWQPLAPRARVDVSFDTPGLSWSGDGYFDTNHGSEPLEARFRRWDWSRAHTPDDVVLFYDVDRLDGARHELALRVNRSGDIERVEAPPARALPRTLWGVRRQARGDAEGRMKVTRTLEDTPFYSRSALSGDVFGRPASIWHESLMLDRFSNPAVRCLLPFRMPRVPW
jgi:carotenoid 1,2-hydratase